MLAIRGLTFYYRMNIALILAAALATATLTGALLVGDSVKATLKYAFDARLGKIGYAVAPDDRFFQEGLSKRLIKQGIETAPALNLSGMVTRGDGAIRVNRVNILGVDERFFNMSLAGKAPEPLDDGTLFINTALAGRLASGTENLDEVVLRFDNPSLISRNIVLAPFKESTISVRLPVTKIVDDIHFGRFSLESNQAEPLNIFVPISWLQREIRREWAANLLLIKNDPLKYDAAKLDHLVSSGWQLSDAGAELKAIGEDTIELVSSRVFIDTSLSDAAIKAEPNAIPILTYFVNGLKSGDRFTPYSMVTAAERKGPFNNIFPEEMKDDEVVINEWLADDLEVKSGDLITLKYYRPDGWQRLFEEDRSFRVCRVIPIEGAAADSSLSPDLPGLSDAENCSEWDPSLPINLDLIRDKDETYWDTYSGTPKAFVTLAAGKAMWASSYGLFTGIRFQSAPSDRDAIEERIIKMVNPATIGLSVIPVYEIGMKAKGGGTDFGQLFLGLSMFLIFSGIILTWLLFSFSIEGRKGQQGMLLAVGFPTKRLRRLYLAEGLFIALTGAILGTLFSLLYTRLFIFALSNAWQGAVAGMTVQYSVSMASICTGFFCGFIIAVAAMALTLKRQMKQSAHSLLSGNDPVCTNRGKSIKRLKAGWVIPVFLLLGAAMMIIPGLSGGGNAEAGSFFGAGTFMLLAIIFMFRTAFEISKRKLFSTLASINSLALRNISRKSGRSLAVIAMLACGVFMIVAVSANRKNPDAGAELASSGTGGFDLYGESSVPIVHDLNTVRGVEQWGIDASILKGTKILSLRVLDGDDASCLNLNRTSAPRILGVTADAFASREAFSFQALDIPEYKERPWEILKHNYGDRIIPAVGDYPTVYWGLGKKTGDTLSYTNSRGEEISVRIAGVIKSSILQGGLVISEEAMLRYFPEVEGFRVLLIDTPVNKRIEVSGHLTKRLADAGLSVETAVDRLKLFNRMENTYLNIFLILGGLGLTLGCVGLGLIVLRNLLERQNELAMMRAVGFSKKCIIKMVFYEHFYLLGAGIITGFICALISVIPAIRASSGELPIGMILFITLLTAVSGVIWVVMSTLTAMKGDILTHLRNE